MIEISVDPQSVDTARNLLVAFPQEIHKAADTAINRTITKVQTQVSKTIRARYVIAAGDIKAALKTKRARRGEARGMILATGKTLHFSNFSVSVRKRGPATVRVLKAGSRKPVKGLFVHAKKGPLHRTQPASYPLRIPYGPSIPQMFGNEETMKILIPIAETTLQERFLHEVQYRYGRT